MKALVVENNALNTLIIRRVLERVGFTDVRIITGDPVAVGAALSETYQVALVEWMLKDTSGLEVVRQLRATPGGDTLPIIAISEAFQHEDVLDAMELGITSFIVKPIKPEILIERVQRAIAVG